jgi:hypothetical protein
MTQVLPHRLFQTYRYGIVDANLREELPDHWTQQVIAPAFLESDTGRSPVLVQTDRLPDVDMGTLLDRLETEMQAQQSAFFSLLLETDADLTRAANHLASRLVVKLERDGRPMQFRYFDPGTFLQLPGLLGGSGMNWLLGPVTSVMVPWAGEFQRYEKPVVSSAGFNLTVHLPELLDIGLVNRAAMQLDPPTNQEDWIGRCERIRGHIQRARSQHRLTGRDDLIAFAQHAESCHPRFDEHKTIRAVFVELTKSNEDDQLDYRELTARLEPETWERIAHDITQNKSMEGMPS